ncbi:hypothetical protein E05_45850 [Plautia stali symbiont]|nr:hypothetical protein E05_45850 [Plautia stali symbiont]
MAAIFSILLMVLTANWLRRRLSWADEIRRAIRNREFTVHYQPVYSTEIQRCTDAEALMRFARNIRDKQMLITLELTERSLIEDGDAVSRKLRYLQSHGMKVAIDDFGTGHCALSYLITFPLDYLKIDRGFINAIEGLEIETPVLDAIINLCHKLQLEVLGEGVETALQFQYLQQRGVVFIQGYYYARPMDNNQLRAWLNQQGRQPLPVEGHHEPELHHS